jgi:hypothetical protein
VLISLERQGQAYVSKVFHCSERRVGYLLLTARKPLPAILDRVDIL